MTTRPTTGWIDWSAMPSGPHPMVFATSRDGPRTAVRGPGIQVIVGDPAAAVCVDDAGFVIAFGEARFADRALSETAARDGKAAAWRTALRERPADAPALARGRFAVIAFESASRRLHLATDRFSIRPLCYATSPSRIAFSDRADQVPLAAASELDPQALLDYLYFHMIPAPRTVFSGVRRLPGGHSLTAGPGTSPRVARYWSPRFVESERRPLEELKEEFRSLVRRAVEREAEFASVGAFLSGGTDSSTVAGMLVEAKAGEARTYSIGFDARGYDEMAYARIAARHFGTRHREYYLLPADIVADLPALAASFDQPFGNSSALPAYRCAQLARGDGVERLLAGDGGDELFGGNSRYAKQRVFEAYWTLPAAVRARAVEPLLLGVPTTRRLPLVRKAASYVEQARLAMPDRLETYNLLTRLGMDRVLTRGFLSRVDECEPLMQQRAVYAECDAGSLVNRMLAFDWKYTLADNDLVKVCGATSLADISVGFPLLDDELTDFSLRLAPSLKVRGLRLRYFFKEALRGFLPPEIIRKKKHGFGLPFGPWAATDPQLGSFARDALRSTAGRGVVNPEFIDELLSHRLLEHSGFYGEMIWILVALEHWLRVHRPDFRAG